MQTDMHYWGAYALARAAGIKRRAAQIIASASEYVDDAVLDESVHIGDGRSILVEMTAHKMLDFKNTDSDDQRRVWLPFHFLPGGNGSSAIEKLVCGKDSKVARQLVAANLARAAVAPYGRQLLGITAHVYADTFSHWGFIGANHSHNRVKDGSIKLQVADGSVLSYIERKARRFFENLVLAGVGHALPLGHGAVATYPDRPYLSWSYCEGFGRGRRVVRDNQADFLDGCKALHKMFGQYAANVPADSDGGGRTWAQIRPKVEAVLAVEGDKQKRIAAWQQAIEAGDLRGMGESPAKYLGHAWSAKVEELRQTTPSSSPPVGRLAALPVYRFYQAARHHRLALLELLPSHGLVAA